MKLSLLILYIVSLASSKIIDSHNHTMINSTYNNQTTIEANYYNKTTEKPTANSFIANPKQCYECNFNIDDSMNIKTLFHNYCANKTLSCDNTFCSIMLSRNKYNDKYMLELGCVSENYCLDFAEQKTGRSKAISNNYSNCCNSNLCNDKKAVERLQPIQSLLFEPEFIINPNNTFYAINDIAPVNQKVIPEAIVSNVLHDFNFEDYNINKDCINEVFFTAKDNLIITLKNNICNNKDISRDDIPFSISQPINKIIFLNVNNQTVYELLSSDKGITSFNYIKDKKLLFFISNDFVFTYKIDDNNQLIKIKQFYLEHKPVDISINYNGTVIAIANKYTVFFYNIEQIEQTQEIKPIEAVIGGFNIYRIQYVPNKDILLVETQNFNNLKTNVYNVENLNKIEFIGGTPIFNRQKKPKSMDCLVYYYWVHNTYIYNREYKKINIHERSYYGKWIISSSGDFIMNHRVIFDCPTSRGINFPRKELYYGYRWNKKINKYSYSINYDIATNLDMFNNRIKTRWVEHYYSWLGRISNKLYFLTDIVAVYEYFFSNNENIVLALIAKEDENNKNNRYLHLKDISYKDIDEPFGEALRNQKRILRYKLFDLAHSGLFNHDSSKLAIFSDNRIKVYLMNLSKHFSSTKNTASMSFTVTPSPAVMTEETSIITSSPAVMTEETSIITSSPAVMTEETSIITSSPAVMTEETSIITSSPAVMTEETSIITSSPAVMTEETSIITSSPAVMTEETSIITSSPAVMTEETSIITSSPAVMTEETSIITSSPAVMTEETSIITSSPAVMTEETSIITSSPAVMTEETSIITSSPAVMTEETSIITSSPAVMTEETSIITSSPAVMTEETSIITSSPAVMTEETSIITSSPAVMTEETSIITSSPAVMTEETSIITSSPAVMTEETSIITSSPAVMTEETSIITSSPAVMINKTNEQ